MMKESPLHPQLMKDTCPIGALPLCHLLLMNNAHYPWVIMVPKPVNLKEITDLSPSQRGILMEEIALVMQIMEQVYSPDKINMAALGNVVAQLHVHVIARYTQDHAWPQPVWGKEAAPYSLQALLEHVQVLQTRLGKIEGFEKAALPQR
jgi:diadenosine tetraphosphate (Ap4A) HIT family hydrolase